MKFLNKLVLRKRVGSFYADHLPDEIRYRNRAGEEVSVPTEKATVDELAFALQLASEEQSIVSRRRWPDWAEKTVKVGTPAVKKKAETPAPAEPKE